MKKALLTSFIVALSAVYVFTSCKKDPVPEPTPTPTPETVCTPTFSVPSGTYSNDTVVMISCATEGASIHYTVDGSAPNENSTKYATGITITETTTLKAIACKDGYNNSSIAEAIYIIDEPVIEQVKTPVIEPGSCTFKETVHVNISCLTEGAEIRYTLDGSEPEKTSELYQYELTFNESTMLKAKAFKDGMTPSETSFAEYTRETEHPQTPEFIYPGGTYVGSKNIAIRCSTPDAQIYYTTDGTDPTTASTLYITSFKITESATIKAIAYEANLGYSDIAEEYYEIIHEAVENPTFSISGGIYNEPVTNLTLSCATEGATIHFTLNGDDPTESSPVYSQPLSFSETTTIKARAFKNEYDPSEIVEQTYVIEIQSEGLITVVNESGTHEFEISNVSKKDNNTLVIKTVEGNNMTLNFDNLATGTFNFPTFEGDPDATCRGSFTYSNITLKFINGGEISVIKDEDNYTLTIDNIATTNCNVLIPVIEHVSLSFSGLVL